VSPRTRRASPEEARKIIAQAQLLPCDDCDAKPGSPCTQPGKGRSVCKSRWIAAAVAIRRQEKAARRTPEQAAILASLPRVPREEIEARRTPAGGYSFTREVLAGWGIPWPPPSGWLRALLREEDGCDDR
jgi:hypothetical protein